MLAHKYLCMLVNYKSYCLFALIFCAVRLGFFACCLYPSCYKLLLHAYQYTYCFTNYLKLYTCSSSIYFVCFFVIFLTNSMLFRRLSYFYISTYVLLLFQCFFVCIYFHHFLVLVVNVLARSYNYLAIALCRARFVTSGVNLAKSI